MENYCQVQMEILNFHANYTSDWVYELAQQTAKTERFVVKGPDGAEYNAADEADALGSIEESKKKLIEDKEIKRSPPGPR